jgi:hypothetical protein
MPGRKGKQFASLSLAELQRLVAQREQVLKRLRDREQTLEKELSVVQAEIVAILGNQGSARPAMSPAKAAGPKRRGRKGRGVGGKTVAQALADIVRGHGQPMRVGEMAEAFKRSGHPTKSKNLEKLIAITIKGSKHFKRVARGLYTAK